MSSHERLVGLLLASLAGMTGIEVGRIDAATSFLDLGADSLGLLQISQVVQDRFGIKVPFRPPGGRLTPRRAPGRFSPPRAAGGAFPPPPRPRSPDDPADPADSA